MPETAEFEDLMGPPRLRLRRRRNPGPPVLYIHGATFPCALSVAYRFADGRSWEDALVAAGFEVWGLDFSGYGGSEWPDAGSALGRAGHATAEIARAIAFIAEKTRRPRINIVAHSWGAIPAAMFSASAPQAVATLTLFAPILQRNQMAPAPASAPAWRLISIEDQRQRFEQDTPAGAPSVLAEPDLKLWGQAWLATDKAAAKRSPPAVAVPGGPALDVAAIWSGERCYAPAAIAAPTLVVRGAWDSLCTDADVARFIAASGPQPRLDRRLPEGGHLMHLETGRHRLWGAVNEFLLKHGEPQT